MDPRHLEGNIIRAAMKKMYPGEKYSIENGIVIFQDTSKGTIPFSEVQKNMAEAKNTVAMKMMRDKRDELLAETDWRITSAMEKGQEVDPKILIYRQALRDLTDTCTPSIDSDCKLVADFPVLEL
jgi:hypothetical protein